LVCQKTSGLLLVMFYSTQCPHCGPARTVFNGVARQFTQGNCKFGMINIMQNPKVTQFAKASQTPITYVPLIMAFFNGAPLSKFQAAINQPNLIQFVQQCYGSIQDKVDAFGTVKKEPEVPAFATGVPFCEDGVCYLGFDDAYEAADKRVNA
jgi:thioredoxin-like negative regulator of GroEL